MRANTIIAVAVAICLIAGVSAFFALTAESDQVQVSSGGSVPDANITNMDTNVPEVASGLTASDSVVTNAPIASDSTSYTTLCGPITDKNRDGFPGATVTLWETQYDSATGQYFNVRPAAITGNPTVSNSDLSANFIGYYEFQIASPGTYNVTAEMNGCLGYEVTTIDKPRKIWSLCVSIRDYDYPNN